MAKKPEAKPKPPKKMTSKEQSERFIQTARALEAEESGEAFEQVLDKVVPAKTAPKDS